MQEKTVHIVFQVLNYLTNPTIKKPKLLPIDKLILLKLASHKGEKGIFPMQETLASTLETSLRYMKTRLKYLEKIGLIYVEKVHRNNHYHLPFLSTIGDLQIPYQESSGDPQITSQVIHRSPHRGSTDATNNKVNNKLNKTERARKKRVPLSLDFHPDKNGQKMSEDVSAKTGLSFDQLLTKFKNLQKSKQATSADWNAEWENFLINERPSGLFGEKRRAVSPANEVRSTVPWYVPSPRKPKPEVEKKDETPIPSPKEVLAMMRADHEKRMAKMNGSQSHGGLTNDADISRDRAGSESSKEN